MPLLAHCHWLHIAVICASPLATWCPRAIPVTHPSPSFVRRHRPQGAHERCPSPACHRHSRVAVSCMVPTGDAHHPHVTVIRASPSAARCPQAMPITHTSPSFACRCQPHGAQERCPSPACRRHSHVAVGRTVPMSDACHPPVAVACMSPSAAQCPQAMPVTRTSPLPAHCRRPHSAHKRCPSPARHRCLHVAVAVDVPPL